MSHRQGPMLRAARARLGHILLPSLAAAVAIILATTATLATIRLIHARPVVVAGATPAPQTDPTPAGAIASATPTPRVDTASSATPAPTAGPTARPQAPAAGRARLAAISLPPAAAPLAPADAAARLLDVTADGSGWASTVGVGLESGALVIGGRDVRERSHALPGPLGAPVTLAARFAPDSTWLAAIDGHGSLWRIDPNGGAASLVAAGAAGRPFGAWVAFLADGRLLLTAVGSVEAPQPSQIVALDVSTGVLETLSPRQAAYQPVGLQDGSLAFVAVDSDGSSSVVRLADGRETELADIGAARMIDVSIDGRRVAFERPDGGIFLVDRPGAAPRRIAEGWRPRFAPDGDRLSVTDARGAREIDLQGRELARFGTPHVDWVTCPEGCAP